MIIDNCSAPPFKGPSASNFLHTYQILLLTGTVKLDGIPTKIKWKIRALLHFMSHFEGISNKNV